MSSYREREKLVVVLYKLRYLSTYLELRAFSGQFVDANRKNPLQNMFHERIIQPAEIFSLLKNISRSLHLAKMQKVFRAKKSFALCFLPKEFFDSEFFAKECIESKQKMLNFYQFAENSEKKWTFSA